MLYVEGVSRIRVEHASILGYLEPVSAPFYALLLLGEAPAATTIAGGALIVAAGVLVVVFGKPERRREVRCERPARRTPARDSSRRAASPGATRWSPAPS